MAASVVKSGHRMTVVTYNVLSSHLASPSHFTHCRPEDLKQETRLARVQAKLEPLLEKNAVVCLQVCVCV